MNLKIVVYTKSNCPGCEAVKKLLNQHQLQFETINLDDEAERLEFFAKCGPSVRQMPQVFINDQRVGGVEGVRAALAVIAKL